MEYLSLFGFDTDDDDDSTKPGAECDEFDAECDNFDDVDQLFGQLEPLAPPPDIVARIMNTISRLPSPQEMQRRRKFFPELDGPIVRHEDDKPS